MFQRCCFIGLLCMCLGVSFAQTMAYTNGQPLRAMQKTDIEGSPYYKDDWAVGTLTLKDSTLIADIALRFDIYKNELTYLKNDSVFVITSDVTAFTIKELRNGNFVTTLFKCGYEGNGIMTKKTFYEVLEEGNISVLVYHKVYLNKDAGVAMGHYGSDEITKAYFRKSKWLLYHSEKQALYEIPQKDRAALLLTLMGTKQQEVNTYMDANKLNWKNDQALLKVIRYFNQL